MATHRPKNLPRDPNQRAVTIGRILVGDEECDEAPMGNPVAVESGRRGGQKGGVARAAKLTPEERREAAKKAAAARWGIRGAPTS